MSTHVAAISFHHPLPKHLGKTSDVDLIFSVPCLSKYLVMVVKTWAERTSVPTEGGVTDADLRKKYKPVLPICTDCRESIWKVKQEITDYCMHKSFGNLF